MVRLLTSSMSFKNATSEMPLNGGRERNLVPTDLEDPLKNANGYFLDFVIRQAKYTANENVVKTFFRRRFPCNN